MLIKSFADYERRFGALDLESPMSYAVRDFYLNGGSHALIVRVVQSAPHRDGWLHGCEFTNQLTDDQIHDLLL